MRLANAFAVLCAVFCVSVGAIGEENIIEDQGVGLSREELEALVNFWPPDMKSAAANNLGDRLELLNIALANKKIEKQVESLKPESDPEAYWRLVFTIRNMRRQFVVSHYLETIAMPDMSDLAEERYHSEKEKYALVAETRNSSHILLLCPPGACDRKERRPEAESILAELQAGANFEKLAGEYSEDPGTKDKGGKFDRWMIFGDASVASSYSEGLFAIDNVGGHTDIIESQFGFHIIQLDGVRPQYYKPYSEVKDAVIADLEREFKELSAKEFDTRYRITDDAFINGPEMEAIFDQYKTEQ